MRALVTGATGFLGKHIVNQLVADGWDVYALHRKESDTTFYDSTEVHLVEGDITDLDSVNWNYLNKPLDCLFHVAGDISMWHLNNQFQNAVNIMGTRNVGFMAKRLAIPKFIHTSSVAAWGFHDVVIRESTEKRACSAPINYMRSKLFAEQEALNLMDEGIDVVILNPCHIMGKYDLSGWAKVFTLVSKGQLPGVPPGLGTFCQAEQVAKAHINAFHKGVRGQNYLLGGEQVSYYKLACQMAQILGVKAPAQSPQWLLEIIGRGSSLVSRITQKEPTVTFEKAKLLSQDIRVDCSLAINTLNYKIVALDELLDQSHRWLKEQGAL